MTDQGLYDAVMAEAPDNPYERDLWQDAADMAARISAERYQSLRDQVLSDLIAKADEEGWYVDDDTPLADWLRAQKEDDQ